MGEREVIADLSSLPEKLTVTAANNLPHHNMECPIKHYTYQATGAKLRRTLGTTPVAHRYSSCLKIQGLNRPICA